MWMSNVATTAMMTPIAQAVLEQLKSVALGTDKNQKQEIDNNRNEKIQTTDDKPQSGDALLEGKG